MKAGALCDKVLHQPLESLPHIVQWWVILSYGAAEAILPSNTELVNIKGSTCCACYIVYSVHQGYAVTKVRFHQTMMQAKKKKFEFLTHQSP